MRTWWKAVQRLDHKYWMYWVEVESGVWMNYTEDATLWFWTQYTSLQEVKHALVEGESVLVGPLSEDVRKQLHRWGWMLNDPFSWRGVHTQPGKHVQMPK
jgi:hypothetical protein